MIQRTWSENRRRATRRGLQFSLLTIAGVVLLRLAADWLHALIRLDPGVVNIGTWLGFLCIVGRWAIWMFRYAGTNRLWRVVAGLLVLSTPVLFYLLTRPVLNGDVGIARFDGPIWQRTLVDETNRLGNQTTTAAEASARTVDLATSTPIDFPQFLGPDRNSEVKGVRLAADWAAQPPRELWRVPVGQGWSGVAVVNGWAVTMEQLGNEECISCYAMDNGKLQWRHKYVQRHEDTAGMGKPGPRATPTIVAGKVYAQGAAGKVVCLEGSTGKLIWEQDVCDLLKIERVARKTLDGYDYFVESSPLTWGRAGSPLVLDDVVIVPGGGPTGGPFQTLLALDKETGELKWSGGDEMIAYGSPSSGTLLGKRQVMLVGERTAFGFDLSSGKELWKHSRPGSSGAQANCCQVTYVDDRRVLLTKGYGLGGELLEFTQTDSGLKPRSVWKSSRVLTTKFSNPVIRDGYVYALADGFLECVELDTGKLVWSLRDKFGHGQLLLVGDHLVVHSEFGKLGIFPVKPEKPNWEIKVPTIKGICWNTLALSGNRLLVRSDLEMACYELPLEKDEEQK